MGFTKGQNVIDATAPADISELDKALKSAKNFSPAYDRILIKRTLSSLERRTQKSGIILTDDTKDSVQSAEGFLVGYGPTVCDEAKSLFGKRILFSKFTGDDIIVPTSDGGKEKFILATDKDIYGELK